MVESFQLFKIFIRHLGNISNVYMGQLTAKLSITGQKIEACLQHKNLISIH